MNLFKNLVFINFSKKVASKVASVSVRKEVRILIDIEESEKDRYVFANWADGENIVDLTSYTFNANTDIYTKVKYP